MNNLIVAWQDPNKRLWWPIGKLFYEENTYKFKYVKGMLKCRDKFKGLPRMENFKVIYKSESMFPVFKNKILPRTRPEYKQIISWMNLKDPTGFELLAMTAGAGTTDNIRIFPCPTPNVSNNYELLFFTQGVSHLTKSSQERITKLKTGDPLFLEQDIQNHHDSLAINIRTESPIEFMGYIPRYFLDDINDLIKLNNPKNIELTVEKINLEAPFQFKLLCKLVTAWPKAFKPCSKKLYEDICR